METLGDKEVRPMTGLGPNRQTNALYKGILIKELNGEEKKKLLNV